jgi:hypothetical protein
MTATVKGLWTKKELAEAHELAEACEANGAHWALADWLLDKEPMAKHGSHGVGTYARLEVLAVELGMTSLALRLMRSTAYSWPLEFRVPGASFSAHKHHRNGGPAKASDRAAEIARRPCDRFGKVRSTALDPGSRLTVRLNPGTHAAVVAEAEAAGLSIRETTDELIQEALGARAWLAAEEAA